MDTPTLPDTSGGEAKKDSEESKDDGVTPMQRVKLEQIREFVKAKIETKSEEEVKLEAEEEACDATVESRTAPKKEAALDEEFASFLAEVDSIPSRCPPKSGRKGVTYLPGFLFPDAKSELVAVSESKNGVAIEPEEVRVSIQYKFGTAAEECERLTGKVFTNSFEVLNLPPNATDEDIKKAFRKISLIIHPDKCKHPKAGQAFHVVNKANEELQKPEMKDKYRLVINEARKRVLKKINRQNTLLASRKQPLLPTDDESIQVEVITECDRLLSEIMENLTYSEKCKKANEEYEKKMEEDLLEAARKEEELKRKWAETRENRVGDWQSYKDEVATKKIKVSNFVPVTSFREKRRLKDKSLPHKPIGIDESYKINWR